MDWLLMEMDDGLIDEETFADLARRYDLKDKWRPQASVFCSLHALGLNGSSPESVEGGALHDLDSTLTSPAVGLCLLRR